MGTRVYFWIIPNPIGNTINIKNIIFFSQYSIGSGVFIILQAIFIAQYTRLLFD